MVATEHKAKVHQWRPNKGFYWIQESHFFKALGGGQATDLKSKTRNKSRFSSNLVYQHDKNSGDKNTGQIERLDFVRRKAALLHALGFLYGASKIVGTNKQKMVDCFCTECFLTRRLLKLWVVFLFYILPILNVILVNFGSPSFSSVEIYCGNWADRLACCMHTMTVALTVQVKQQ